MGKKERDPFGPVESVVQFLFWISALGFLALALVLVLLLTGHQTHVSVAGIGSDPEPCVSVRPGEVPYYFQDLGGRTRTQEGVLGLRKSVATSSTEQVRVCLKDGTAFQQLAASLEPLGDMILAFGSMLLILRTVRAGRHHGLFRPEMAGQLRRLGWFLLVMSAVYPFIAALGRGVVLSAAVRGFSPFRPLFNAHLSVGMVVVALGVLSLARILSRAVPLQQEVDATV